jgi:hypothetical protein
MGKQEFSVCFFDAWRVRTKINVLTMGECFRVERHGALLGNGVIVKPDILKILTKRLFHLLPYILFERPDALPSAQQPRDSGVAGLPEPARKLRKAGQRRATRKIGTGSV